MTPTRATAPSAARAAASIIASPPRVWTVASETPGVPGRGHRVGHGVRDVVPLEIEEDLEAPADQRADQRRAFAGHEDRPDLDPPGSGSRSSSASASAAARRSSATMISAMGPLQVPHDPFRQPRIGQRRRSDARPGPPRPEDTAAHRRRSGPRRPRCTGMPPVASTTRAAASTPIGSSGGPLTPPLPFPSRGAPFPYSKPGKVLTTEIASAPASLRHQRHARQVGDHRRQLGQEREPGAGPAERRRSA